MFTIIIQEKGGEQRRMVFNKPEVTIGRVQGNDIVLPKGNVSKRHARIVLKDGKFIIVDLKSTNGTYVNGRKITSPLVVKDSDKIYIGDFIVGVDEAASGEGDGPSETTTSPPGQDRLQQQVAPESRPPRPTEAAPQPMAMPPMPMAEPPMGPMGSMAGPPMAAPPAVAPSGPRPGPPRPAPGSRDLVPPRERDLPPPREMPPREPPGPRDMPPIVAPPAERARPPGPRPGGTMPPPMIPPVVAPQPASTAADPHFPPPGAVPSPAMPPPMAPPVAPLERAERPERVAPPVERQGPPPQAQVVPLPAGPQTNNKRQLVGAGAKKVIGRPLSMPSKRGVQLEPLDPKIVKMLDLQSNILERLRAKLDLDKVPIDRLHEEDLWQRAERATIDLVETLETSGELPKYIDQDTLIKETLNEALALGPLEDLFADEKIDEIIIDRRDRLVVGKDGVLRGSGKAFSSDDVFERVVKRLVAEAGSVIDEAHPLVDLRMRDGTRLTAAVSPVAARGACLVLKKPASQMPTLSDLVQQGTLSSAMADFLATCVSARRNILVCGAQRSGKTSLVAALAAASPPGERLVSIEEVAELSIARDEWIQLESRPPGLKGAEVDMATLLEAALRLMPDRLVIGELRGREALAAVSALNASVDGAVVAMTGEGSAAVLGRLATLARAASPGGSDAAIRELCASAFEIVIHVVRHADGAIKVHSIEEVVGVTDTTFETQVLFHLANGNLVATGTVPRFYSELEARGIPADQAVFR
ncbi:MAG TPA: ATPase, T2SS/T4P/T4SS family [Kofleriaceae bacterium]|nr:ATPase, T2SS/T4P/T4SS family [Kofleriaceae bacterium]